MVVPPSLFRRIAIGKGIGFLFGLVGVITLPWLWPEGDWYIRVGLLLWYTTFGAIIGVFGVVTWHPTLNLPMPWWIRAPAIGAWLNFVLLFFTHRKMRDALESMFGVDAPFTSPFWFVLEGAIVGLIIGFFATRFGGEGAAAAVADDQ